jgi:hypothetical protein
MKDSTMAKSEWRTVQFFLSPRGVFEVSIDIEGDDVRCTCPGFESRNICKHSRAVISRATKNDGVYPLKVSSRAPAHETASATSSAETFREFVIKYGYIEV